MCLVSHSQAVGVRSTTGPHETNVGPACDPAQPWAGTQRSRTVRADSAAEASYVLAVACRSNPFPGRGHGSEGGDMTSKRIRTIAGWMLAPLLVAGAVTAQAGAASGAATGQGGHHKILYVSRHSRAGGVGP